MSRSQKDFVASTTVGNPFCELFTCSFHLLLHLVRRLGPEVIHSDWVSGSPQHQDWELCRKLGQDFFACSCIDRMNQRLGEANTCLEAAKPFIQLKCTEV